MAVIVPVGMAPPPQIICGNIVGLIGAVGVTGTTSG